ncbi:MAG: tRNA adenosine(34) deaminase TadA [Gammaproteobacteria bacterium]|nr:tRNA adenosine(34) deaminase TadA [Gammaproteobacteria bacterium]MYD77441.1 tRNA adenosine(34) deaminase TadA [Gammaproteobacteria bacterium]MYI89532.1 tRNA adenosine(34) deaminase TadA [Gammaproteobacteria bacterium]
MRNAIGLANAAYRIDEVPIGAVVVQNNQIIGQGYNRTIIDCDPSAHAEVIALRSASICQKNHRLPGASLYVTIEPCAMCAGAIIQARIETVVFGAFDPKSGAAGSVFNILNEPALNHQSTVISGILEQECAEILKDYFRAKRDLKQ